MFRNAFVLAIAMATYVFAQGTFTDSRDGKKYKTVKIGSQVWMAQNLDYSGEDGDIGFCQDNDPNNCSKYGRLYNWEDAMLSCPDGWHLPSEEAWRTLASVAGSVDVAGQKLKARNGWEKWDCEWTEVDDRGRTKKNSKCNSDNFGFSALPSTNKNTYSDWWTSTESHWGAVDAYILYNSTELSFQGKEYKMYQSNNNYSKTKTLSVRCLKGEKNLPANLVAKKTAVAQAEAEKKAEKKAEAENPLTTEVTSEGTIIRGSTLTRKLAWLNRSVDSHNTYIIEVNANENIAPHVFDYKGAINVTIILRGDTETRTIRLSSHGRMFNVKSNVTFVLDNNVTLQGHNENDNSLIFIEGGTFKMNANTTITGNTNAGYSGGGVYIGSGTFEMYGGIISGNRSRYTGGGVVVLDGIFNMHGGTISGNIAGDGTVSAPSTITSSRGANRGGGVSVWGGSFIMHGGTIAGNFASEYGAGVFLRVETFNKRGGTITGYGNDQNNGNEVKDLDGTIARRGHAIYFSETIRKETTAGPDDNMSLDGRTVSGFWDDTKKHHAIGSFPIAGTWKIIGRDSHDWTAYMVIEEVNSGSKFSGYFDWNSPGWNASGREYFRGEYEPQTRKVLMQGYRLENANGIGTGKYEAYIIQNGYDIGSGTWGGAGVSSGTWEAKWQH